MSAPLNVGAGARERPKAPKFSKKNLPFSISELKKPARHPVATWCVSSSTMKSEGLITPAGKAESAKWEKTYPSIGQSVTAPPGNSSGKSS